MLKKALSFFESIYNFSGNKRMLNYSFAQNDIFKHACSTPLTILMSNLEEELADAIKPKRNNRLSSSLEAVKRLTKLIRFVADDQDFYEKFVVRKAIDEVIYLLRGKIDDDSVISSKLLISKNLCLFGNKLYFQEALSCILNNSIEAYRGKNELVTIIARKVNDGLKIDVVDYASGMNLFVQKLVLLNGVSTKKKGMGLGLSFAKKTIEEIFFGKMIVKSTVGFGTHIKWTIPLKQPCNQNP